MKLNGWRRLWIVIGFIYLLIIIAFGFQNIPTEKKVYSEWSNDLIKSAIKNGHNLNSIGYLLIREAYPDMTDKEFIKKIQRELILKNVFSKFDIEKINNKYQSKLENLQTNRWKAVGLGASIWITPMLVLYIFGCSLGWIYRGFKHQTSNT